MISWIKKHFIPHEGNDNLPHMLRSKNIRNVIFVLLFLEVFTFLIPTITRINSTGGMAAVLPAILADLTNEERQIQKLEILAVNPTLNKAAEMKANDMAEKGYFAHTSPEGKTPWYWLSKAGYEYQYAGENLAINFTDSKDVTNAWMASPTHKANIVKGNYTEMGTGIASGTYEGRESVFVAQVYANPLPKTITQTQPIKSELKQIKEIPTIVKVEEPINILGAETVRNVVNTPIELVKRATLWQKLIASPRNTTNIILYVVFGIVLFALLLYIIVKMRNHHKGIITNGLMVLVIIGAIFLANYYLSYKTMVITQSLDYSNQNK